ncbi:MAG: hypothetical protein JW757_04965 [Anaerolineales bacterium]|nr:hypothetical protein [Anaerolineales bacterium]
MWKKLFTPGGGRETPIQKEVVTSWDVVVLTFQLAFQQIQFWVRPNIWLVLLSLPMVTAPAAKAALYQTVAAGLRDPALIRTNPRHEVKSGFFNYFWLSLGLVLLKWLIFAIIFGATLFWITRKTWLLQSVSIITFYVLAIWWLSSGYLYPILIHDQNRNIFVIARKALKLALTKPFDSLLFSVVSTLLSLLGIVLLGPILLIIPSLRSILHLQGYWYVTGQVIPGFMDIVEYTEKFYN